MGPVIVKAKIIIQLLWEAGVSWDGSIPLSIHTMWIEYREQLPLLSNVRFDRLIPAPDHSEIQMHGFSDASEKTYRACIYLRSTDARGSHAFLVSSKSRVAPVSSGTMTLPRLELCAALLLAQLVEAGYFTFEPLKSSCVKINVRINIVVLRAGYEPATYGSLMMLYQKYV